MTNLEFFYPQNRQTGVKREPRTPGALVQLGVETGAHKAGGEGEGPGGRAPPQSQKTGGQGPQPGEPGPQVSA